MESVYTRNRIVGSNPTPSEFFLRKNRRKADPTIWIGVAGFESKPMFCVSQNRRDRRPGSNERSSCARGSHPLRIFSPKKSEESRSKFFSEKTCCNRSSLYRFFNHERYILAFDKIHQRRARETRVAGTLGSQRRNDCLSTCRIYLRDDFRRYVLCFSQNPIFECLTSGNRRTRLDDICFPAFPASLLPAFRGPCADELSSVLARWSVFMMLNDFYPFIDFPASLHEVI